MEKEDKGNFKRVTLPNIHLSRCRVMKFALGSHVQITEVVYESSTFLAHNSRKAQVILTRHYKIRDNVIKIRVALSSRHIDSIHATILHTELHLFSNPHFQCSDILQSHYFLRYMEYISFIIYEVWQLWRTYNGTAYPILSHYYVSL